MTVAELEVKIGLLEGQEVVEGRDLSAVVTRLEKMSAFMGSHRLKQCRARIQALRSKLRTTWVDVPILTAHPIQQPLRPGPVPMEPKRDDSCITGINHAQHRVTMAPNQPLSIAHCSDTAFTIEGTPLSAAFDSLMDCVVHPLLVHTSVMITGCRGCNFDVIAQQIRLHHSTDCQVTIKGACKVVLEGCSGVQFHTDGNVCINDFDHIGNSPRYSS